MALLWFFIRLFSRIRMNPMPTMKLADAPSAPFLSTMEDRLNAKEASRMLAPYLRSNDNLRVRIEEGDQAKEMVPLPPAAVRFLIDLLLEMAKGNAVTMIPIHAELTTQEAANILNASRPFVVQLIDDKKLTARKEGSHRRILFADLMAYKQAVDADRGAALDNLARQA
jgi:excisionase family DNA binding protein